MALPDEYENVASLTRRMLEAARIQNWDELTSIGATRESLLGILPKTLPPMSAQDSQKIARLIEEILACHAEIADRACPWLEHTAQLLAAFDRAGNDKASSPQTNAP